MNKYNKLKLIGKGSYGTVYKIEKKNNKNIYALKQINAKKLKNNYEIKNLINELKILCFHECEYLLKCREIFYDNHQINIVTDFAKFSDLSNYIEKYKNKNKFISEKTIWLIFIQCCYGIEYLHEYNIIHRDLKPANILLANNSSILLADFGISKIIENRISSYTLIGTPYYISPEMYKDINYNKKIDIWSLGCILYELTTLTVPFKANDMIGLKRKVISGFYDKVPSYYSKDLNYIINLLLDKNLYSRPNIKEILNLKIFKKKEHELNINNSNNFLNNIDNKLHNKYTLPKITSKWNLLIDDIEYHNNNKSPKIDIQKPLYPDVYDDNIKKHQKLPEINYNLNTKINKINEIDNIYDRYNKIIKKYEYKPSNNIPNINEKYENKPLNKIPNINEKYENSPTKKISKNKKKYEHQLNEKNKILHEKKNKDIKKYDYNKNNYPSYYNKNKSIYQYPKLPKVQLMNNKKYDNDYNSIYNQYFYNQNNADYYRNKYRSNYNIINNSKLY